MRARRLSIGAPPTPERPSQRLSASAGEIGGNGGYTPVNPEFNRGVAASECAFSGLNDEYVLDDTSFSRVQT